MALTRFAIRIPVGVDGWWVVGRWRAIMGHLIRGGSSILHERGWRDARTIMPNAGNQNSGGVYSWRERELHPPRVASRISCEKEGEKRIRRKMKLLTKLLPFLSLLTFELILRDRVYFTKREREKGGGKRENIREGTGFENTFDSYFVLRYVCVVAGHQGG